MPTWEYKCLQAPHTKTASGKIGGENIFSVPQIEKIMNELGSQGWELTGVWEYAVSGKPGPTLFFKRQKP